MPKQLTIRGVSEEVSGRLEGLSRARGSSVNATVLEIIEAAVAVEPRRNRLARYATWTDEDRREFEQALAAQRTIDDETCEPRGDQALRGGFRLAQAIGHPGSRQ